MKTATYIDELMAAHDAACQIDLDEATHIYTVRHPGAPAGEQFDSLTWCLGETRMNPLPTQVDPAVIEAAGWRGTNVHLGTELLDTPGGLDWSSLSAEEVPYVQAYDTFKDECGFQPVVVERKFASLTYKVACRVDRVGQLRDGDLAVADIKTGEVKPATALQLAGCGWMVDPTRVFHRFAVRLKSNGDPKIVEFPVEEYSRDVSIFLSAVAVTQWRYHHLKGLRRPA